MKKLLILILFSVFLFSIISVSLIISEDNVPADTQQTAQQTTTTIETTAATFSATSAETSASTTNTPTTETSTAQTDTTPTSADATTASTDAGDNKNGAGEFNVDPGMTPDNPLYFVKDTYQRIVVGNDPEKALDYREQKIAEAKAMIEEGNEGAAEKSLDRALQYGDIVEKEVNPESKDDVQQRSEIVQNVIVDLKEKVNGENVKEKFDENLEKEKKINTAVELVAKINELCQALAKIDPLQYADSCKPKDSSPRWMKEQDKELTKDQQGNAKIFFEKLSQCFENPENCDCKGMGIQSFEDYCLEKSSLAVKCKNGDKDSCSGFENGADPPELLPDYLVSSFRQVEGKYMKSEFDMYTPEECVKAGAKTPEECSKVMFKLDSPQECIDAGLTGKSQEDEIKCKKIMFEKNTPQECIDAGLTGSDPDAPRKCAKIMFEQRVPQECFNAGITGERRDDEKRCRELIISNGGESGNQTSGTSNYAPKFNRDCNSIKDSNEKMKCYEEFYNNAQVQVKDDFRQREFKGESRQGREFAAKMGAANPDRPCPDGVCDQWEKEHLNDCPEDCGGVRRTEGNCQTNEQIERLKQDCKNRGQDANVETRGGCPWVICIGGAMQGVNRIDQPRQSINKIDMPQQTISGGQKCPDNVCDEYERMNPYACPEDCGGQRVVNNPQQNQQPYQQPENRIDQPQQPYQQPGQQVCSGQAPSCAPNGAPFCDNGNWVCPQPQQQQEPMQEQQPAQQTIEQPQVQQPTQEQTQTVEQQTQQSAQEPVVQQPAEPAPVTGQVTGIDNENIDNQKEFWNYWFVR